MAKEPAAETRSRILEQSMPLFAAAGYDGVSMRAVAAQTRLTTAALYYHFPDKEQLYLELIRYAIFERMMPHMALEGGSSGWAELERFVRATVQVFTRDTDLQRLMQWVMLDRDDARAQALTDNVLAPFYDRLLSLVEGMGPVMDSHFLVTAIFSLIVFPLESRHARRLLPGYQSPLENPERLASQILQLLKGGLSGEPE